MRKVIALFISAVVLICMSCSVFAVQPEDESAAVEAAAGNLPAFPGAEGGGMYATGARASSSPSIYHVTNLNDSGTGSLRDAVSKDNRIIVFDVAGTIKLESQLSISQKNLTILGQTAPGDGICIKGSDTYLTGQNIILRYIRFRMGTPNETLELNTAQDVLDFLNSGVRDPEDAFCAKNASNFIIDHCSMSWSTDECCSVYAVKDATIQWCIIGEGLNKSIHVEKGNDWQEHSYGGLVGGINLAFHHNLWANCKGRFPRIATSSNVSTYNKTDDKESLTDVRNNVMYNWGVSNSYGGENLTRVNLVGNYYKEGPASTAKNRFYQMSLTPSDKLGVAGKTGWSTDLAIAGNYYEPIKASSKAEQMNDDNKLGVIGYNDATAYKLIDYDESNTSDADMASHMEYIKDYPITTTEAKMAFDDIIKYAGVSHRRDSVDTRLVNDALNGTGTVGTKGLLNFPGNLLDPPTNNSDPAAWPQLSGTKQTDTDGDGIPDEWEDKNGLNKNDASDALEKNSEGYFNIEAYANAVVTPSDVEIADRTELNDLIIQAKALKESEYTSESWSVLSAALLEAQSTAGALYPTQSEVDAAANKLRGAIEALVRDYKAVLKNKLDEASGYIYNAKYTNASRAALQNAFDSAQTVFDDDNATDAGVETAVAMLEGALNSLVLVPTEIVTDTLADFDFNDGTADASLIQKKDKTDSTPYYYLATGGEREEDTGITAYYKLRTEGNESDKTVFLSDTSSSAAAQLVIPIKEQTGGRFELTADVCFTDFGSKMQFLTLRDNTGAIVSGIGLDGSKYFAYCDGESASATPNNEVTPVKKNWYNLKLDFDMDNKTASAYIKEDAADEYTILSEGYKTTASAEDISSLTVQTSISNTKRWIYLDNVKIVCTSEQPKQDDTSPTPRPTGVPAPTSEPEPSATPAATATAQPTATPVPTATAKPSAPTATAKPASPTATAKPSAPTATAKPTPAPTATPIVNEGVYYSEEPSVSGSAVTAKIMNTNDSGGVLFMAAAYDENGMLAEIKTVVIEKSMNEYSISETFNKAYSDIRFYLWSKETLRPYSNVK